MVEFAVATIEGDSKNFWRMRADYQLQIVWFRIFLNKEVEYLFADGWIQVQFWLIQENNASAIQSLSNDQACQNEPLFSAAHCFDPESTFALVVLHLDFEHSLLRNSHLQKRTILQNACEDRLKLIALFCFLPADNGIEYRVLQSRIFELRLRVVRFKLAASVARPDLDRLILSRYRSIGGEVTEDRSVRGELPI